MAFFESSHSSRASLLLGGIFAVVSLQACLNSSAREDGEVWSQSIVSQSELGLFPWEFHLATLDDGGSLVMWHQPASYGSMNRWMERRRYDSSGALAESLSDSNWYSAALDGILPFPGGGRLSLIRGKHLRDGRYGLYARAEHSAGWTGERFLMEGGFGKVAALVRSDREFLIAYEQEVSAFDPRTSLKMHRFGSDGRSIGPVDLTDKLLTDSLHGSVPTLAPLADGGWMLLWVETIQDPSHRSFLMGQCFDSSGMLVGNRFRQDRPWMEPNYPLVPLAQSFPGNRVLVLNWMSGGWGVLLDGQGRFLKDVRIPSLAQDVNLVRMPGTDRFIGLGSGELNLYDADFRRLASKRLPHWLHPGRTAVAAHGDILVGGSPWNPHQPGLGLVLLRTDPF